VASAEIALVGHVSRKVRQPEAVRRPLRLLLAASRLRSSAWRGSAGGATPSTPPRWWASRGRRTSSLATCCRSCWRRSSRS
jgi:hypothetical protein